jgi:tripartite ATP-independent transporter DctP family solute receptor
MLNEWSRRTILAAAGGVLAAAIAGPALAQQPVALKWAHVYETSEPYHTWAVWAGEELAKRTDNRFTIEVFPASSLGKEVDINEAVGLGTVDIIYTGQLFAGRTHGPLAIGGSPFMFRDYAHWEKYRGSDLFKELAKGYADASGNDIVTMTYYGQRHVTSKKPILKPEDMAGLKIRVPNAPLYKMFPEAVGANPAPIAFAEVYLALQQGVVDAQENPLPTIQAKKFYEPNPHINLTGHITDALLTIIGGPAKGKLSAEDLATLEAILIEAADKCTQDIIQKEEELVAWFKEQGVEVHEVDRTPFREAVVKLHNGPAATWPKEIYDRLQGL